MASSPSSSSQPWVYDVFLSFRGDDTRKNFVDHLYTALDQQGIYTYKDDETLPRGELIGPALLKAIRESRIAVIVFSENYADSSWCLDELEYIMKCVDERGQIVMPIFYHVDPSHVRKLKEKYGEAFVKHQREHEDKSEAWKKALVDASNISGWDIEHVANGHEAKGIKEIVAAISERLYPLISDLNQDLVGIESRIQDLKSQLRIGSGGVHMVGVWGVGGGGKTTLASCVYDEISSMFDGCCFVHNIREKSNETQVGLEKLQSKVISDVMKQKEVYVGRVEEGRRMIKKRLCQKSVLLVLDDVDDFKQLEALAGSHDWFGEGSRIIITTRDIHVLNAHKVYVIHNISLLNVDEAIKLLSKHAPRGIKPIEDYDQLAKEVVSYAGGLPLALKVLGCFLCDKDMNEWKSALARLKEIPDTDIMKKLEISFDGLRQIEKELFLDIACFYRGDDKNIAMEMLDACGFHPIIGIKVLKQKALISIKSNGELDMHDLVQEMGRDIVRRDYPKNPEKQSRIWKEEDVQYILASDTTMELDNIQAIRYYRDHYPCPLELNASMKKLRLIEWNSFPGSSLPTSFLTRELCCLILWNCRQRQLWEGYKFLPNLRYIKVSYTQDLITTPHFDGLPNLERFSLIFCFRLEEIHPSIGSLERLVFLEISHCSNLKKLPPINRSKKLETLFISECPNIFKVSEIQQTRLQKFGSKFAYYKQYIATLFVTYLAGNFRSLYSKQPNEVATDVVCCLEESFLPHSNINHTRGLPLYYGGLRKLSIVACDLGDDDICFVIRELFNLQELDLSSNKFSRINFSLLQLPRLKRLIVSGCGSLTELLELPSSLAILIADGCSSLASIGDISNCKIMRKVSLLELHASPIVGRQVLDSMLLGNASEDHIITLRLGNRDMQLEFVDSFVRSGGFTLQLPHKHWYDDFCGFIICIVTDTWHPAFTIILKPEIGSDFQSEVWQECNGSPEPDRFAQTYAGFVSFNWLKKHTPWWNSAYNMISLSVTCFDKKDRRVDDIEYGAKLVPRRRKGDEVQTEKSATNYSEYWDEENEDQKTFTIQHDSISRIKIVWNPWI